MKRRLQAWPYAIFFICCLLFLIAVVILFDPSVTLSIFTIKISIIPLFFIVLLPTLFSFFYVIFLNTRRSFLAMTFVLLFLLLRFFGFSNALYAILLLAIFILTELLFIKVLNPSAKTSKLA